MGNDEFGRAPSIHPVDRSGLGKNVREAASETLSRMSEAAQEAGEKAKQVAADTASTLTYQVKDLLDRQVGSGAEMVGHVASSTKRAAEELQQNAPQLAGLVLSFADRIDALAGDLKGKSASDLVQAVSNTTRRQPALVFGLAALAGFFAFRTLKSTSTVPSPPTQPMHQDDQ